MIRFLVYFFVLILLLAVNIFLPKIGTASPNLLFILVVLFSFASVKDEDDNSFIWLAFFAGLLLDLSSAVFFGTYTVSFLLIAVMIHYFLESFFIAEKNIFYVAVIIITANLFLVGLIYLFGAFARRLDPSAFILSSAYLGRKIWLDLLLNLIFAAPIYFVTILMQRMIQYYRQKLRQYG